MSRYIPTNNEMRGLEMMRRKKKNSIMFWIILIFLFSLHILYSTLISFFLMPKTFPIALLMIAIIFWLISSQFKKWKFYDSLNLKNQYYYTGVILRTKTYYRSRKSYTPRHYVTFQTEDGTVLNSMQVSHSLKGSEGKEVVILCQGLTPILYIFKEQNFKGVRRYGEY